MAGIEPFKVEARDKRWAITADNQVLVVTRTRREAQALAQSASDILNGVAPEGRSFAPSDQRG